MERLPPSAPRASVDLLGRILDVRPSDTASASLRLAFFAPTFSWQALIDFANVQQLLPAVVWSLRNRGLLLPLPAAIPSGKRDTHVTQRLTQAFEAHLVLQHDLRQQLLAIIAAFNERGLTPLLIKGARHLLRQESWWVARGMRDLDIMVRPDQAECARDILAAMDYRPDYEPELEGQHHLPQMRREGWNGAVEIHIAPLAFNSAHLMNAEEAWELSEAAEAEGRSFRILPAAWHVLHGLLHHQVVDRGHRRRVLALKGLWEFAIGTNALTAEEIAVIAAHMERRGSLDILASWLLQAHLVFGLPLPDGVAISEAARAGAQATLARADWPYPLRRTLYIADQLRFAFSPATLALRYQSRGAHSKFDMAIRHLGFLARKYRTGALDRIFGSRDRMS